MTPPGQSALYSLIYVSSAVDLLSPGELLNLLHTCRRNNTRAGITGMLLYKEGNFMQVLEGDEPAVRVLHDKIARDPRHDGMITLLERQITHKDFGEWSMGFVNLANPTVRDVPGYSEFLNVPLLGSPFVENPSRAARLLATFKQKM